MYARRCLEDGFIVSMNCSNLEDIQNHQDKSTFHPSFAYGGHTNGNAGLLISEADEYFCKDYTPTRKSTMDAISPNHMDIIRICINSMIGILMICGAACIFGIIVRYKQSVSRISEQNKEKVVVYSKSTYGSY
jgi:hypothetical protein